MVSGLCISHIFRKESQKVVIASKVEIVGVRAIWQETVESNREENRGNLTEIKQW